MTDILHPGSGFVFMKVGMHAQESLTDIIQRKQKEIEDAGFAFWGYGGNTCHPLTMVQPFVRDFLQRDGVIYLCMQPMQSNHRAEQERAAEFSADGAAWEQIPDAINVLGSRYALAIDDLHKEEFELPLAETRVGIGKSKGRRGDVYITGHVDKACFEVVEQPPADTSGPETMSSIGLVARIVEPYAVLLR